MKTSFTYLIILSFGFIQCSPTHKTQEASGNNFEKLVKKLEKDPGDEKNIESLVNEYRAIQQMHLSKIKELEKNSSSLNNELLLNEYITLQQLYTTLSKMPAVAKKTNPQNYSEQTAFFKTKLVNSLLEEADDLLKQNNKPSCRKSYYNLVKLQSYQANDNSIADKIRKSLSCASINISVSEPLIDPKLSYYHAEIGEFYRNLNTALKQKNFSPFVVIAENRPDIDETIQINFTHFETGNVIKDNNSRDVVNNASYSTTGRRAITTGTGTAPSSATVTTTRSTSTSTANILIEILSEKGLTLDKQEFTALHEWNNEVNTYSGDRRALTASDRTMLRNPVKNPPPKNEIADNLLKQLTEKILNYLQNRYAGF